MLTVYDNAHGLKSISPRYYDAAGAHPNGILVERHDPEIHLKPSLLQSGSECCDSVTIFGMDYPTSDGTCIRDYVHVLNLYKAHLLVLEQLTLGKGSAAYNLANGFGFSIQEIIDVALEVEGCLINITDSIGEPVIPSYCWKILACL